jgi:hypothetical protein
VEAELIGAARRVLNENRGHGQLAAAIVRAEKAMRWRTPKK